MVIFRWIVVRINSVCSIRILVCLVIQVDSGNILQWTRNVVHFSIHPFDDQSVTEHNNNGHHYTENKNQACVNLGVDEER